MHDNDDFIGNCEICRKRIYFGDAHHTDVECVNICDDCNKGTSMPSDSEIRRRLILIYSSNNAHHWANYTIPTQRLNEFCKVPVAKQELIETLRELIHNIETNYGN